MNRTLRAGRSANVTAHGGKWKSWPGSDPGMARGVYVSAPPASSVTVTVGQRAPHKVPTERTREVTLDTGGLCGHSGQKPRARPEPARTGRGPSPATCGAVQLTCN